jgi:apolipoprotein N-acyltransferase
MTVTQILKNAVGPIVYVFGLFGGFMIATAPPHSEERYASVGIASVVCLFVLLAIRSLKVISQRAKKRHFFMVAVLFGILSICVWYGYRSYYLNHTYVQATANETGGTAIFNLQGSVFLEGKAEELQTDYDGVISNMMKEYSRPEQVWTKESVNNVSRSMSAMYVGFMLCFGICLFGLVEGVLRKEETTR